MLITALERANAEQKAELVDWIGKSAFVPEEKIKAVTAIYDEIGIASVCTEKIEELYAEGMTLLEQVELPDERKNNLREFAYRLMGRKL